MKNSLRKAASEKNVVKKTNFIFLIILLLASSFRLYNLNWDSGFHLHPDERMLTMVTEKIHWPKSFLEIFTPDSPLNPKFFPYGSLPIYLLRGASNLLAKISGTSQYAGYSSMNLVGRFLSVLFDLGTCFLLFKMGKKVFSSATGLLAAAFYATAAFPIQLSHFFAVDTFLSFFVIFTLYRLVIFFEKPVLKNFLLAGVVFGFALATKVSATVLLTAFGVTASIDLILVFGKRLRLFFKHKKIFYSSRSRIIILKEKTAAFCKYSLKTLVYLALALALAFATFAVFEPYAIIDFSTFIRQTKEQQAMTQNAYIFPYTLQYVGTVPFVYHLKNLVFWGTGLPLGLISVVGVAYILVYLIKEFPKPGNENQEAKILILLVFLMVYFFVVGRFAVKFMRYLLPLYPIFFLFAAWVLENLSRKIKIPLTWTATVFLFPTLFWSIAFVSIYSRPNTRVVASKWMVENIAPGSFIAREHWDDGLPLLNGENFEYLEMPMYESDRNPSKWKIVNANLQKADYLVLASNRLYIPLIKLSDCNRFEVCYPKTAQYYQGLFSGKLGFDKVAEFSSNPSLLGLEINDQSADESFTVYDHPKIIIFKKNENFQKKYLFN